MSRYTWTTSALNSELGLSNRDIRELIWRKLLLPEGWEEMSEADRSRQLASLRVVFRTKDVKYLIQKMLKRYLEFSGLSEHLEENTLLIYEMLSEIKEIRRDFDLSLEPMTLKDIAVELKVSVGHLHNCLIKIKPGVAMLPYPKKKPFMNLPLRMERGGWVCDRFEFLRQKRQLGYNDLRQLEKTENKLNENMKIDEDNEDLSMVADIYKSEDKSK